MFGSGYAIKNLSIVYPDGEEIGVNVDNYKMWVHGKSKHACFCIHKNGVNELATKTVRDSTKDLFDLAISNYNNNTSDI